MEQTQQQAEGCKYYFAPTDYCRAEYERNGVCPLSMGTAEYCRHFRPRMHSVTIRATRTIEAVLRVRVSHATYQELSAAEYDHRLEEGEHAAAIEWLRRYMPRRRGNAEEVFEIVSIQEEE